MSSSTTTALSRRPLREVLEGVADPGDRRGVRHCLTAVLCLAVVGVLAGCRTLGAMREHVADLEPADLGALGPGAGRALPSESTIRRVLERVNADDLDARVSSWLRTRVGAIGGRRVIAVEDETMRGARGGRGAGPASAGGPGPGRRRGRGAAAGGRQVQRDTRAEGPARAVGPRRCGHRRRRHGAPRGARPSGSSPAAPTTCSPSRATSPA